jgi:hypothetical protein
MVNRLTGLLALLLVVLAFLFFTELKVGRIDGPALTKKPRPSTTPSSTTTPASVPNFTLAPVDTFSATIERPLFSESRRPTEPSATEEQREPSPKRTQLQQEELILGAIILANKTRLALLRDPKNGNWIRVEKGGEVGGWSLEEIHSDRVILNNNGKQAEIQLWRFEAPPPQRTHRATPRTNVKSRTRTSTRRAQLRSSSRSPEL